MNAPSVSVITPVGQAFERVKQVLFRPFDLGRWFVIGFGAWLAHLGQGGGGYNFRFPTGQTGNVDFQTAVERARDYVAANLYWIVPVAVIVFVCAFCIGVLLLWLSSRGTFMFLHCVALNRAEVVVPWNRFQRAGNSLFWFRLLLGLANFVIMVPLLVLAGLRAYRMLMADSWPAAGILTLVGFGLALVVVAIAFGVVHALLHDFVVPIMFLRGKPCLAGWRELQPLLAARVGSFVLYFLFQIVLGIAIGVLVVAAVLVTCCIAGCLLMLPYIGTVALLPVLVFQRAYSLFYFAQFGPEFDVFRAPAPPLVPPPAAPPPPPDLAAGV